MRILLTNDDGIHAHGLSLLTDCAREVFDEVIVVARAQQADRFGAASNSILNREELRSAVGTGSDVMRALDGLPGLVSTGDFANFTVRGRGPRDNLIFVDGLESGTTSSWSTTAP